MEDFNTSDKGVPSFSNLTAALSTSSKGEGGEKSCQTGEVQGVVLDRYLIISGSDYIEVQAENWWKARNLGAKRIREEKGWKMPLRVIEATLKVMRLGSKFDASDVEELLKGL